MAELDDYKPGDEAGSRPPRWQGLGIVVRWETLLFVVLVGLIVLGSQLSPVFLSPRNFANLLAALMEVAIMAVPMTLVIIAGEIDLSVESMAGLSCAVLGFLWAAGVPIWIGVAVVLVIGAIGGAMNGTLIARFALPSLVVTLGTLALFRGLALIVLGPQGVSNFPPEFTGQYFFADYCAGQIYTGRFEGGFLVDFANRTAELAPGGGLSIATIPSFGQDARGELYICDGDGEVYKIVPETPVAEADMPVLQRGTQLGDVIGSTTPGNALLPGITPFVASGSRVRGVGYVLRPAG